MRTTLPLNLFDSMKYSFITIYVHIPVLLDVATTAVFCFHTGYNIMQGLAIFVEIFPLVEIGTVQL